MVGHSSVAHSPTHRPSAGVSINMVTYKTVFSFFLGDDLLVIYINMDGWNSKRKKRKGKARATYE
jgi:hypothetical protein